MEFAANGANIAIIYAGNTDAANDTISEIEAKGVKAKAYQCDVSSFDNTKEIINQIIADFGQVDILVNNAGITKDGLMSVSYTHLRSHILYGCFTQNNGPY